MPKAKLNQAPQPTTNPETADWKRTQAGYIRGRSFADEAEAIGLEMERKWGPGRLRLVVSPELRARFDTQRVKFNNALWSGDLEEVERESHRMANAWRALDKAATEAGKEPCSALVWEIPLPNGKVVALVHDIGDAPLVRAEGRYVDVYTTAEMGHLIVGFPELVTKAKVTWPGAEVVAVKPIRDPLDEWEGDSLEGIPFP